MNLITFAEPVNVNFRKSAGTALMTFDAGRDYVLPMNQLTRVLQQPDVAARAFKVSRIEYRFPNFHVSARKAGNQRLLVYNGSGGYGDQIITWPFTRILASLGFEVHVLTDPGNQTCWWNLPWVRSIQAVPMQYEQFKMYDYHLMMESIVNTDEHPDQIHPLDVMLARVGIDPNSVDPKLKVVRPNFTYLELLMTRRWEGKRIAMYQLAAANQTRSLPPNDSAFLLGRLADAYPDLYWLALSDEFNPDAYRNVLVCPACGGKGKFEVEVSVPQPETASFGTIANGTVAPLEMPPPVVVQKEEQPCPKCKGSGGMRPNIQLWTAPSLRELWAATSKAAVVVAPDSMMVHVAGVMSIPCVGLWGLTNPANRVRYYTNHHSVWRKEACPFAPCYAYGGTWPKYCPPRVNRQVCEVMAACSPQDVMDGINLLLPK